ncbi:MAG: hypothetical protein HYT37_01220 [Candidatus Sungbacteria bacterium]|nr:hypothetical protein [Candidatus Sungbacteria bacterium]
MKILVVFGLIWVLFLVNYSLGDSLSPKPFWLDVAIHGWGGQLSALLCGFVLERFSLMFRVGSVLPRFVVMVACGLLLGALLEAVEMFGMLPIYAQDTSYWNLVQDLTVDFVGSIIGAFTYFAWNLREKGRNVCR